MQDDRLNESQERGKKEPQPKTEPSGNQPPPRPPNRTAVGLGPEDDDPDKQRPKSEIVRINLLPKPSVAPTIQLPTLPPGGPTSGNPTGTTVAEPEKKKPWWKFW